MQSTSPRPSPNCGSDDSGLTLSTSHQVHTELQERYRPINREEFKIAIICALPLEYDAMCLAFDEFWDEDGDPYGTAPGDANTYTTGRIGDQNVVLVLLQRMGKTSAASAVASMKLSYTGLRQALLVGICGGVPKTQNGSDIMLGDVIISRTIVQYDFGKRYPDRFIRKQTTTEAQSNDFRGFAVMAETMRGRNKLSQAASKLLNRLQDNANGSGCGTKYVYPGLARDKLFESNYRHKHHESPNCACKECHDMTSPVCDEALTASCSELGCSSKFLAPRDSYDRKQDTNLLEYEALGTFLQALHPVARERALVLLRFSFGQQPQLIEQVSFSPVLVIDARGRHLPFHLETISSKEVCTPLVRY
ncbi:hypothetical protein N5P37_000233 [Trichoderma harzianum]|nr:hypothetical protein N5P37_000233 [Trichoderma harzianum]